MAINKKATVLERKTLLTPRHKSPNVLLGWGSEKALDECLGIGTAFTAATRVKSELIFINWCQVYHHNEDPLMCCSEIGLDLSTDAIALLNGQISKFINYLFK